jgi:hypothetical protein
VQVAGRLQEVGGEETTGILAGDFILTAMMILTLSTTVIVMIEQVIVSRGKEGIR